MLKDIFQFQTRLGGGWSADTWLAALKSSRYGLAAGETMAVKRYKNTIFEQAANVPQRIEREGRIGSSVVDDNVVTIYELFQGTDADGAREWALIMELCSEGDLTGYIAENWPLSETDVLRIARGLVSGLSTLHTRGIIHRDIKPDNVLMVEGGVPKIGDFGVVDHIDEETLTATTDFLGTIRYSAPEVLRGGIAGADSDMYSLGTVLYQLLYGYPPYRDATLFSAIIGKIFESPPDMPIAYGRFGSEPAPGYVVLESICRNLTLRDRSARISPGNALDYLDQGADNPLFRADLLEEIRGIVKVYPRPATYGPESNFLEFASWKLWMALTPDDAAKVMCGAGRATIEGNPHYRETVREVVPSGDAYAAIPHEGRAVLMGEMIPVWRKYVEQSWEDREVVAARYAEFRRFARARLEVETDDEFRERLENLCSRRYNPGADW